MRQKRNENQESFVRIQKYLNGDSDIIRTLSGGECEMIQNLPLKMTIVSPIAISTNAKLHGFRLAGEQSPSGRRSASELAALLHSEISEFFEGQRKGKMNDEKGGAGEELADIYIRLADTADELGIDLATEVRKKHEANIKRPYLHGKLF